MCPPGFKIGLPQFEPLLLQAAVGALTTKLRIKSYQVVVVGAEVEAGISYPVEDRVSQLSTLQAQ